MSQVFISYSRKDEEEAQALVNDLRKHGVEVWLDTERIQIGDNWWAEINRAITDAKKVLVLLSPNAVDSEWVEREAMMALKHNPASIVPVIVEGDPQVVVPTSLKNLTYFDARHKDENTIEQLAAILRKEPVAS